MRRMTFSASELDLATNHQRKRRSWVKPPTCPRCERGEPTKFPIDGAWSHLQVCDRCFAATERTRAARERREDARDAELDEAAG
jgi:hypothetical protein